MVRLGHESDAGGAEGSIGGLNPRSFEAFYRRYRPFVLRWFERRIHNGHVAGELTDRTFLKAFEEHERHRGTTEQQAVAWVLSIARTELLQFIRHGKVKRGAQRALEGYEASFSHDETRRVEQLIDARAARTPLREALAKLPEHQREAFARRVIGEESVADVARAMGVSEIAVRTAVFRARRRLSGDEQLRRIVLGDATHG